MNGIFDRLIHWGENIYKDNREHYIAITSVYVNRDSNGKTDAS